MLTRNVAPSQGHRRVWSRLASMLAGAYALSTGAGAQAAGPLLACPAGAQEALTAVAQAMAKTYKLTAQDTSEHVYVTYDQPADDLAFGPCRLGFRQEVDKWLGPSQMSISDADLADLQSLSCQAQFRNIYRWHSSAHLCVSLAPVPASETSARHLQVRWELRRGSARVLPAAQGCADVREGDSRPTVEALVRDASTRSKTWTAASGVLTGVSLGGMAYTWQASENWAGSADDNPYIASNLVFGMLAIEGMNLLVGRWTRHALYRPVTITGYVGHPTVLRARCPIQ